MLLKVLNNKHVQGCKTSVRGPQGLPPQYIAPYICSHHVEGITLEKPPSGANTETLKNEGCQKLGFNVLLAQTTNLQHTSLLKCSLKLKLHQLKAYKPPYRSRFTVKAQLLKAFPVSTDKPLCTSDGATLWSRTAEPQLYLPGIKMTVIIRVFQYHTCASGIPATLYTPASAHVSTTLLQCSNSSTQTTDASIPWGWDDHWHKHYWANISSKVGVQAKEDAI